MCVGSTFGFGFGVCFSMCISLWTGAETKLHLFRTGSGNRRLETRDVAKREMRPSWWLINWMRCGTAPTLRTARCAWVRPESASRSEVVASGDVCQRCMANWLRLGQARVREPVGGVGEWSCLSTLPG